MSSPRCDIYITRYFCTSNIFSYLYRKYIEMKYKRPNPKPPVKLRTPSTSNWVDGLEVKDGRLINNRPDGMTGIAKAASIRRAVENDRKINMIAEGIQLAEDKKNWRELEY